MPVPPEGSILLCEIKTANDRSYLLLWMLVLSVTAVG